jgi:hypothetical protein
MERAERAALYILCVGIGATVISVAGPLAFDLPKYFWYIMFYVGVVIVIIATYSLVYEYRPFTRPIKMFLFIGILCVIGSGGFFWSNKTFKPCVASRIVGLSVDLAAPGMDYSAHTMVSGIEWCNCGAWQACWL